MKLPLLISAAAALPLAAQSLTLANESGQGLPNVVSPLPVEKHTSAAPAPQALPLPEQRLREGLVLLASLHDTMAGICDNDTAEAAVAPLMRLHRALQEWTQSFTALPPLTEQEQQAYEERYLPFFKKLNSRIRTQGDRLAAAEYYGSKDLPAALMHLAIINH